MMRTLCMFVLAGVLCGCIPSGESFGKFEGKIEATWCEDGRRMELLEEAKYLAPDGTVWIAPKGSVIDGASIPSAAWSIIGGPFEGKYRKASVFHDVACVERKQPWKAVARMFYTAMRASDVDEKKAKVMYAAVYHLGPHWDLPAQPNPLPPCSVNMRRTTALNAREKSMQAEKMNYIMKQIETNNPSLDDIDKMNVQSR